jgi:hypothetical protein
VKNANFQYSDIITMPTYERKYFIGKLLEQYDIIQEQQEKNRK